MIIYLFFFLSFILSSCSAHSEDFILQNQFQSKQVQNLEQNTFRQINQIREKNKLKPLQEHSQLSAVARAYSKLMTEKNFFNHKSPNGLSLTMRLDITNLNYILAGENLFMSFGIQDPASKAIEEWMNSPKHKKNILNSKFTHTGLGIWKEQNTYYFTQVFVQLPENL